MPRRQNILSHYLTSLLEDRHNVFKTGKRHWRREGCSILPDADQTQEIEAWVTALARYDNNEFEEALGEFDNIADTSKILFNMGVIHATLGEHEKAVRANCPDAPIIY